jgi:hypothetical protein
MELVGLPAHAEPLPVLRIQPLSENGELPAPYALIANLLLTLSQAGDASSIQSVLSTPNLYSALRLDRALESLSTSPVTALREREYAKQALVRARRSWIARMRTMLEGMPIDWNRLNQD